VTSTLIAGLAADLAKRSAAGLARNRRVVESAQGRTLVVDGRELVSFASNDYLGLASHPALAAAATEAIGRWGVGAGASHLVCGHTSAHDAMEQELASFVAPCNGARAVAFSSGYLANLAILTALADRETAIFADRLNHACLNDGALLSRAQLVRYAHGDTNALSQRLASTPARSRIIATDAVFSMDGDVAPLPELLALAERYDAWLVVDDAHGFGVLGEGRGSLAHFKLASERIVYMGTLGKAAGVAGAFVAAHPAVIATLVQAARPYIYTTAQPAMLAEAVRAALAVIRDDAGRRARLFASIARFRERARALPWRSVSSPTAIQPLIVGDASSAVALSQRLAERGLWVPAIRAPTVPAGTARLRVSLNAVHTDDDIDRLLDALAECSRRASAT
jgi:8-amino-7-oxononanoate synthase